ncbi:helix-turn-helix domain-containing protein [Pseudomaricurvus hydrocarbonicus]
MGYMDLKNQLRRDIAIRCLVQSSDSIEKISSHTGFSEASTFIREFKKWTGVTPHTYRKCARK